jgi:hypothetical protein
MSLTDNIEYEFATKSAERVNTDDTKQVELTFHFKADGEEENGSDLLYAQFLVDYKGLNLSHVSTVIPLKEVKKLIKYLNEAVTNYENWDWENGREKQ